MTEQMNVPKLRFGEFNYPWKRVQLKALCSFEDNKRVPLSSIERQSRQGQYRYYGASGVIDHIDDFIFDGEYVLLGEDGANIVMRSTPLAFVVTGKFWVNNHAHILKANGSTHFLAESLERINYQKYNTGTAQPKLNADVCKKIWLTVPQVNEQQKIASFLSKVDEKITLLTEKKAKLTEYKKGVMQQLFDGSFQEQDGQLTFNPPTLRFKADDGSEFPDWEEKTMVSLFPQIRNGFVGTATPFYASFDNGVKYLQGKNIKKNRIDDSGLIYVNNTFHVKNTKSQLKVDDIVMVQSGHVGECARITKEFDGANCHALLVASPNLEKVNSSYFVYYFYSPIGKAQTHKITTGNTIKHILGSDLKDIKVNAPSLSEQTKIANFLSTIDQKIDLANSELEKAKEWKKGLLQQMFV